MLLTAALAMAAALVTSPVAHAEDQRPCVSKVEFNGFHGGYTRAETERRWEAAGVVIKRGESHLRVAYLACGYGAGEAGINVTYRVRDRVAVGMVRWTLDGRTLHGHN